NESTTPSRARMRLAVTSSSIRSSSAGMALFLLVVRDRDVSRVELIRFVCDGRCMARLPTRLWSGMTISTWSKPASEKQSKNEAHGAGRAALVGVDQHPAPLDAEGVARPPQDVTVAADILPDPLVAAIAIADEVGRDGHEIAVDRDDAH